MNVTYSILGLNGAMYMLDMWYCVYIVLCAWWICGVVCIWCYVHVGYGVLCIDDAIYMLDVQCYVQVVLHACGTLLLCTYGVVCMIIQVVLCVCGFVYI